MLCESFQVILDLVPNHTSNQHTWFNSSLHNETKYADYYIWHDGITDNDGQRKPPNNWVSVFNGTAWTFHDARKQYYFHQFYPEQPDLNYNNSQVQTEMKVQSHLSHAYR